MSSSHGPRYAITAEGRYLQALNYSQAAAEKSERYRAEARREKAHRDKLRLNSLGVELKIVEAELSRMELEIAYLINKQLPSLVETGSEQPPRFLQECFFCAEDISALARVCRYCKQVQPDRAQEFFTKQLSIEKAIKDAQSTD